MNELKELTVDEISLVDAGANPEANIVFFKRKEDKEMADKVEKIAPEAPVDKKEEAVEKSEPIAPVVNVEVKPIEKADLSEFEATIKRLEGEVKDTVEKLEQAEYVKIAAKYEIVGEDVQTLAKQLRAAKAASPEMYDYMIKLLDDKVKAQELAGTFEEIGKSGRGVAGSPESQIEKIAADLRAKDPTLSYRKSIDAAFQSRPDLIY